MLKKEKYLEVVYYNIQIIHHIFLVMDKENLKMKFLLYIN